MRKYLINDAAVKTSKPVVYAAIQRFEGQVSVWDAQRGPCYRCLYPAPPKASIRNCAEAGIIGAVAGIVGTTQAMQCIALIVGHASFSPLVGKLLDHRHENDGNTEFKHRQERRLPCMRAGQGKNKTGLQQPCMFGRTYNPTGRTSWVNGTLTLIDVREKTEWDDGYIEHALHYPLSEIEEGKLPAIPQNSDVILYCQRGMRSLKAAQIMLDAGFQNVQSLRGGYEAWISKQRVKLAE